MLEQLKRKEAELASQLKNTKKSLLHVRHLITDIEAGHFDLTDLGIKENLTRPPKKEKASAKKEKKPVKKDTLKKAADKIKQMKKRVLEPDSHILETSGLILQYLGANDLWQPVTDEVRPNIASGWLIRAFRGNDLVKIQNQEILQVLENRVSSLVVKPYYS